MPMLLLVGEVFGVDANDLSTLVAVVGKDVLVTLQKVGRQLGSYIVSGLSWCFHLDAVGMIISQDIPGQTGERGGRG